MLGGFGVVASALLRVFGFPVDDSYIHQTVARNFVLYHVPGLVPGRRSSGSTSVIWSYIQAARYWLFSGMHPVLFNLLLSVVLLAVMSQLLYTLAQKDLLPRQARLLFVVGPAVCGNFLWLGLLGMEHVLFCVFSLAAVLAWCDVARQERTSAAIWTGVFAGLIALTRPEGVVFVALAVVSAKKVGRTWRDAGIAFAVWLPFLFLLLGSNLYTSHSLLPGTYAGRSWLNFHDHGGPHSLWAIRTLAGSWFLRLPRMVNAYDTLPTHLKLAAVLALVDWFLLAVGVWSLFKLRATRIGLLCAWCLLHMLTYVATFPNTGNAGRYQPLLLLLGFPLMFLGLWSLLRAPESSSRGRTAALWTVVLVVAASSLVTWRAVTIVGTAHIEATHARMAAWIQQNVPPDASIASFDIGRISYERKGKAVIDLGGLADSAYIPYLESGHIEAYLVKEHVDYVVLPSNMPSLLGISTGHGLGPPLAEYCSPEGPWLFGYMATHHAAPCQTIYRVAPETEPASNQPSAEGTGQP